MVLRVGEVDILVLWLRDTDQIHPIAEGVTMDFFLDMYYY